MNNFFGNSSQFQNNKANAYYPEALNINAHSQSFNTDQQDSSQQNTSQQNQNFQQNIFSNLFNGQNGNNMFSNLFNNNELLSSLLASNLFGNNNLDQKNNMIMQALSNMLSPTNKNQKQSEENVEKVIDASSTFEEL